TPFVQDSGWPRTETVLSGLASVSPVPVLLPPRARAPAGSLRGIHPPARMHRNNAAPNFGSIPHWRASPRQTAIRDRDTIHRAVRFSAQPHARRAGTTPPTPLPL